MDDLMHGIELANRDDDELRKILDEVMGPCPPCPPHLVSSTRLRIRRYMIDNARERMAHLMRESGMDTWRSLDPD